MVRRIFLLFITNVAAVIVITIIIAVFGIDPAGVFGLAIGCFVFGMAGAMVSLMISKWAAKRLYHIRVIDNQSDDREDQEIFKTVARLAQSAKIPVPEVGIYQSDDPNAFATGATSKSSLIAFSSGLLKVMTNDEVEAVAAHEISHISNGDMVTMSLLMGIANAFVMFLARIVARAIDKAVTDEDNPFGMGIWAYWILVWLLETVFMLLAYIPISAFSRWREYRADMSAGGLTSNKSMAKALQRLEDDVIIEKPKERDSYAFAKISSKHKILLFETHPPISMRIERLLSIDVQIDARK